VSGRWTFVAVGGLAMLAGALLWFVQRPQPALDAPRIAPSALFASTFQRLDQTPVALREYAGKVLVLNFWATWCAPCREEMPAFDRLQSRLGSAHVRFVGLTGDDATRVARFLAEHPVSYPILLGGDRVDSLAKALGDRDGVLPFTVVVDPEGRVVTQHVGTYSAAELAAILHRAIP
jgi:thiol-disulfide isomerase/thioredoxin